ncbi:uncharacterized protein LOC110426778 [Herrania umbratica]|uniref:Uncharacterized protein LOC110426778 n=1 Tax=Herrania umbratica TaxID=108875 RepID=A0A6J1BF72_9ROSI|nr:uncharacterized protein LOC110426778 [Herrania umbratica]
MTTLQRSSVSFRRQGSSGRIWNDRHIIDPKTGLPNAAAGERRYEGNLPSIRSPEETFSPPHEEILHPQPTNFQVPPRPENNDSPSKVQRCGISLLFGRCMGPTA